MNEPERSSAGLGSAQSRPDATPRERTGGRAGRGACVPMSCGVVYSLRLYVSIADAPLDYVATLLVMTGRDSNELPCCVCGGTVTCTGMVQVLSRRPDGRALYVD